MNWSLVQPRRYSDTFGDADYHRDMPESPELISRFPADGTKISGERYISDRQKNLRRQWDIKRGKDDREVQLIK